MRNTYLDMEKIDAQEAIEAEEDEWTVQRMQGTNAQRKLPKAIKPYFWQFRLSRLAQVTR